MRCSTGVAKSMMRCEAGTAGTRVQLDWAYAVVILAFAALIRLIFFRGALGTDELVYITRAYHLLDGDQVAANYIGALRYGINAFQAASLRLFGSGVAGADGLFFACSLGEVLLAYAFAHHLWGRRAAIWAALALATVPVDVTLAGGLNPDAYLALIISASVIVFYFALKRDRPALYLAAGLLAGWVFWIKEAVIIFAIVFVFFVLLERRWHEGWWWFVWGGAICLLVHLFLLWVLYGDPFYIFEVLHRTVEQSYVSQDDADTSPQTYAILLFIKIYHTGLVGWLALAGCVLALVRSNGPGVRYVVIWGLGFLLIFSAFPISFSPLKFIGKSSNYMEIFVMPLALLAGWFLAQQHRGVTFLAGGAMIATGILLSALEQQVVSVVAVNGRSAARFAEAHPRTPVFGPLTAQRQSTLERLLRGSLDASRDIRPVADLRRIGLDGGSADDIVAYIVEDPQMRNWPDARKDDPLPQKMRECLLVMGPLDRGDLGAGRAVVAAMRGMFSLLPPSLVTTMLRATDSLWQVFPAQVYAVTRECAREGQA